MRVLIACEFSGIVRTAFERYGHESWSCDLLPSEIPGRHLQMDIRRVNLWYFDLMIAHPPCTYLSLSGARWNVHRRDKQDKALYFVHWLMQAPVPYICIENPVGAISRFIRRPDQYVHPWQFGHAETKKTGLWLKNLPLLRPTHIVREDIIHHRIHWMGEKKDRWMERSRFYSGIALAMAQQWGMQKVREMIKNGYTGNKY